MEKLHAEELDAWRGHPVTQALAREIRAKRHAAMEDMAGNGGNSSDAPMRLAAGQVRGYAEVLRLMETRGVSDDE